tara:strand:+ start:4126 stop:4353 length:228 start_codon:yes stop_codon:yes gene_type:complete
MDVILEKFPYRYVQDGIIKLNGKPDYRIQKYNEYTKRYNDMYLCDNVIQFDLAIEDTDYTKWLDPEGVPCYVKDD